MRRHHDARGHKKLSATLKHLKEVVRPQIVKMLRSKGARRFIKELGI